MHIDDTEFTIHINAYRVILDADNFAISLSGNSEALKKSFTEFNDDLKIQINIFNPEWTDRGSLLYIPYGYDEMFYEDSKLKTNITATAFYSDDNILCIENCVKNKFLIEIRNQMEFFLNSDSKIFCTTSLELKENAIDYYPIIIAPSRKDFFNNNFAGSNIFFSSINPIRFSFFKNSHPKSPTST